MSTTLPLSPPGLLGVVVFAGRAPPASRECPVRAELHIPGSARRPAPPAGCECKLPAPGGRPRAGQRAELGTVWGRTLAGPRPRHLQSARGLSSHFRAVEGRKAGAMQSESGIVPDFEVGEEFHEEPKTYYELKSQPLKSR